MSSMNEGIVYGLAAMLIAFYGPRLHPKLPTTVRNLFNNSAFRFVVLLLIAYLSMRDIKSALLVTILFLIMTSLSTTQEIEEKFTL